MSVLLEIEDGYVVLEAELCGVAGGKTIRVPLARLDEVSLGGIRTALDPVAIVDLGVVRSKRGRVDAVLGGNYLSRFALTLDYAAGRAVFLRAG